MAQGFIKNANGSYSVNYEDQRFKDVKAEQAQKEAEVGGSYDNMINNSDQYYDSQIQAAKDYANTQSELQQANTNFAIQQIEQQKEQTQKDYTKEQKGSYVDYLKQTKSNAQNMANSGLSNTGYSESALVSIYNSYQNRVATAKDSLDRNILNYNNSITQAQLANNEKLAEIAYNSLQMQNNLSREAFEYKNTLLLKKEEALERVNEFYYERYQNVLAQINTEIELQMELDRIDREYEQWLKEFNEKQRQWQKEYDLKMKQYALEERESNAKIAAAKAQERAYSSGGSSNPYGGGSSSSGLSAAGKKLLQEYNAQKGSNKYLQNKSNVEKLLLSAYYGNNTYLKKITGNSKITQNDIAILRQYI